MLDLRYNNTKNSFALLFSSRVCVCGGGRGQTLNDRVGETQRACAPSHRPCAPTVTALPLSYIQTWRNSLPLFHHHHPHPHPPPLHRCHQHRHHHHHRRHHYLRYRDDPGGWRSCRRACRRPLGARWRCRWTRWSASSVCPLWSVWPTVRETTITGCFDLHHDHLKLFRAAVLFWQLFANSDAPLSLHSTRVKITRSIKMINNYKYTLFQPGKIQTQTFIEQTVFLRGLVSIKTLKCGNKCCNLLKNPWSILMVSRMAGKYRFRSKLSK